VSVDHYENFPVASWLCPAALRPPIQAIYWFARTADDIADEGQASAEQRRADLQEYRQVLFAVHAGQAPTQRWQAVFLPLQQAIQAHRLPLQPLADLLDAFLQDCANPLYPDRASLLDYCRRSANPIGRLLLHLHGVTDPQALHRSDAICTALQLINFWQDLSRDLPRGRCYLPQQEWRWSAAEASASPLLGADPAARRVVEDLCDWARGLMLDGQPLVHRLPGRVGWELRLVVQGGLRILDKLAAQDHDSFSRRPQLTAADALLVGWRALTMRKP
jgi:hydroxysqualene synthase